VSEERTLTKHAGTVSGLTLLSRVAGLVRDMVFAFLFGAGTAADAFNIAFTIPNVFRRLLAEGALSIAFVPVFTEYKSTRSQGESQHLYNVTFTLFLIVLVVATVVGVLASPLLVKLFAPGFEADKFELTVFLNRLVFPYIFFIGFASLLIGILHTHRHFAAPAAAPVLLNAAIITAALLLSGVIEPPITAMAIGVLSGGLLEVLLQLPFVRQKGIRLRFRWDPGHQAVRKMLRLMGPAAFGIAVYQVNILVSRALASLLAEGSVTYIYYSDRFLELPLGVFAVAVATVALPSLSEHASLKQMDKLKETLGFALRLTLFVCIPAMVWMAVCRTPLLATLLQRGAFTPQDTLATSRVFLMASLGIWAVAGIRNLVPAFYAQKDVKTPVAIAFVAFLVNAGAGLILMWPMGPSGLTLANTISSTLNVVLLAIYLRKKIGPLGGKTVFNSVWRVTAAALCAGAAAFPFTRLDLWTQTGHLFDKVIYLALAGLAGMAAFFIVAAILRVPELSAFFRRLRGKKPL
jgi:putative peptidoglycan lipid II flippase